MECVGEMRCRALLNVILIEVIPKCECARQVEKTLEDYKNSAGDTAGAAAKEIESLKGSLAEAADKAAQLRYIENVEVGEGESAG